jgi:hypothetical protein
MAFVKSAEGQWDALVMRGLHRERSREARVVRKVFRLELHSFRDL